MNAKAEILKIEFNVLVERIERCSEREKRWINRMQQIVKEKPNYFEIIPEKQGNAILQLNRMIDERILSDN